MVPFERQTRTKNLGNVGRGKRRHQIAKPNKHKSSRIAPSGVNTTGFICLLQQCAGPTTFDFEQLSQHWGIASAGPTQIFDWLVQSYCVDKEVCASYRAAGTFPKAVVFANFLRFCNHHDWYAEGCYLWGHPHASPESFRPVNPALPCQPKTLL